MSPGVPHHPGPSPPRVAPWLTRGLIGLLGLDIALAWVAIQATLFFAHVVWHGLEGAFLPGTTVRQYGRQLDGLLLARGGAWLLTALVFLTWIGRLSRDLPTLGGPGPATAPRRGVAAFLVPGPNPLRVPAVVRDLWHASDPRAALTAPREAASTRSPVTWWWGLLVTSVLIDLALLDPTAQMRRLGLGAGMPLVLLAECLRIAVAALTIAIVLRISGSQAERLTGLRVTASPESPG
jgi:hypothetical protein